MIYTISTVLYKKNIKNSGGGVGSGGELDIMFSAGQTEIKKICYSGIRYGLTLT
jgi:hypothetical protein